MLHNQGKFRPPQQASGHSKVEALLRSWSQLRRTWLFFARA